MAINPNYFPGYHPPGSVQAPIYRGGAAGVQSDLDLRNQYARDASNLYGQYSLGNQNAFYDWQRQNAQFQNQANNNYQGAYNNLIGNAAGMATNGQIAQARGDLSGALGRYQGLADNGMYTGQQLNDMLVDAYAQQARSTAAMQQGMNANAVSRGMGANPGAIAALSMAGQFSAAGARGERNAALQREQAQSKITGIQGVGDISGQMAHYAAMPTQENALALKSQLLQHGNMGSMPAFQQAAPFDSNAQMNLYNQYRNATIGQDGQNNWGTRPVAPQYPIAYGGGSGGHGGSMMLLRTPATLRYGSY